MNNLYYNGQIVTVDEQQPLAEALLVVDGRIEAVGSNEAILAKKSDDTRLIDLMGKTMLPGFVDGHGHIGHPMNGFPKVAPPPVGVVDSLEKFISESKRLLAAQNLQPGEWFVSMGYDNAFFEGYLQPTRWDLDLISTEHPILSIHVSGHVAVANSLALQLAGLDKDSPNPEGGVYQRDGKTGELLGILEEKAIYTLSSDVFAPPSVEKAAEIFAQTQKYYAGFGITTAQDGGLTADMLPLVNYCQDHEMMLIDVYAYPMVETSQELLIGVESEKPVYDRHFRIAGAKLVADGSPQGKTAWLTKPYFEAPEGEKADYCGYPIYTDEQVSGYMMDCLINGWQLLHHCNGDAAADQMIRLYRQAQGDTGLKTDLRPVMVHAQTVREDQLDAMKEIGILPTFFHDHVFYWGDYHLDSVLGPDRGRRISPLTSALSRGINFTLHQDNPVTPPNMIFAIHNAVNRQTRSGRSIGSEYAIDVQEAIKAVTINGAYQCFEENIKGSLTPGKYADLVILDKNPLQVAKETLKDIRVLETIKEGKCVYQYQG